LLGDGLGVLLVRCGTICLDARSDCAEKGGGCAETVHLLKKGSVRIYVFQDGQGDSGGGPGRHSTERGGGDTSANAHPVAAIPPLTQGIAHVGSWPAEACPATKLTRVEATRTANFMLAGLGPWMGDDLTRRTLQLGRRLDADSTEIRRRISRMDML